ncbi:MAG: SAM-dependent methyltransferase [Burkholderiales bacterium]
MPLLWRKTSLVLAVIAFTAAGLSGSGPSYAQSKAKPEYTPHVGQEGKDVIWVPTPQALVERMLQMAKVTPADYVVDLGSGDGRTVITAAKKFGVRALGIEYNPDMVELSKRNAEKEGVAGRTEFMKADIFTTDFSKATVITMYLLPQLNLKLRPTLLNMKPGTRVVSHAFSMDDWQPDQIESVEGRTAYLWIVPARVEGTWQWSDGRKYEITLRQHFQMVEGLAKIDGQTAQFRNGKLQADKLSFTLIEFRGLDTVQREFTGRVSGNLVEGTVKLPHNAVEEKWSAHRVN